MPGTLRRISVVAALATLTCGGLDNFEVKKSATAHIPGATVLDQLIGNMGFDGLSDFDIAQSGDFKNQGVKKNQIDSVRLSALTLKVVSPAGDDLSFFDSLEFFIEAPGQPRQRIAHSSSFPAGASNVDLEIDDVELKPYAVAESMSITTAATGHRPAHDTDIQADLVLDVNVNVSGLACGG